jgi:hypothetical protein
MLVLLLSVIPFSLSIVTGFPGSGVGVGERVGMDWLGARVPRPRARGLAGVGAAAGMGGVDGV